MKNTSFLLLLISLGFFANAQINLTLQQALERAIQQNEDIAIVQQKALLESQKIFKANAGLTPTVSAFANGTYTQYNTLLGLNSALLGGGNMGGGAPEAQEISEDLAGSMTHSAGGRMDYTLYDGGRGKKTLRQLENLANLASLQQQLTTDNVLLGVSQRYLSIASMERMAGLLRQNIELSQERLERAELDNKYAKGNGLSVLRAKTDLNTDNVSLKNLERDIVNTKQDLLRQLDMSANYNFSTAEVINLQALPDFESLKASALQKNPQILLAKQGIVIDEQQLAISETANLPRVSVYGSLDYFRQDYEVNQIEYLQNIGPSMGFSVQYSLYDGNKRRREQDIQRMQIRIREKERVLTSENVLLDLNKSWNNYQNIQTQLAFKQQNLPFYEENLNRLQTNYKTGKASETDIRNAQLGLLSAQISITRKEIELQMEHFKLLKIAGMITTI
ncbi:MAG: TolC family protein [Bacteroidota bacterium]